MEKVTTSAVSISCPSLFFLPANWQKPSRRDLLPRHRRRLHRLRPLSWYHPRTRGARRSVLGVAFRLWNCMLLVLEKRASAWTPFPFHHQCNVTYVYLYPSIHPNKLQNSSFPSLPPIMGLLHKHPPNPAAPNNPLAPLAALDAQKPIALHHRNSDICVECWNPDMGLESLYSTILFPRRRCRWCTSVVGGWCLGSALYAC